MNVQILLYLLIGNKPKTEMLFTVLTPITYHIHPKILRSLYLLLKN